VSLTGPVAYPVLFALVGAESAGVPLPGETSVIAAGVLVSQGHLDLPLVIAVAAAGAIVGDNVGYVLGRSGLRRLFVRGEKRERLLQRGEAFFDRYGGGAVFIGRWVTGVRVVIAWVAGASRYPWPRFFAWNALGGICWAASIASAAYLLGAAAKRDLTLAGFLLLGLVLVAVGAFLGFRLWQRRARAARPDRAVP
jgi:membrane protein DedA with SNARE-associated domain